MMEEELSLKEIEEEIKNLKYEIRGHEYTIAQNKGSIEYKEVKIAWLQMKRNKIIDKKLENDICPQCLEKIKHCCCHDPELDE
jgi:hypothetical protein